MAVNTTTSAGLSAEIKEFYDRTLLERALPNLVFVKYGQKRPIPKGNGKTIEFRKFNSLKPATTPLTEGTPPTAKDLSVSSIKATVAQYGDVVSVTDVLETTAYDPIITETVELEGEQAGETLDRVARDVLLKTTNVYNVGGGVDVDDIASTDKLTADEVLKIRTIMKRNNIKPFQDGYYLMFCSPEQIADVMRDELWQSVNSYNHNGKNIEDGEVGRIHGFKFIDTSLVEPTENKASTPVNIYSGLAVGKNAYGIVDIENGSKPKSIIKIARDDDSDRSDPLNQISTIGWKALFTAVILDALGCMRVNSAATEVVADADTTSGDSSDTGSQG